MFPDQVIYTASGDLTTLNAILNAVAMVCQENATIFSFALAAAMWSLFSMTVAGSAGAASGGAGPDLARRAFALLIPFCLAICLTSSSMKTTVTVESGLTGATTSVDNIPVIISVVPATASLLSKIVGQKLETAMQLTSNDYNSIASSQQGFVNPLKTLLTSRTAVMRMGGIASEVNSLLASCLNNDSGADYASIANHVQFAGNLPSADAGPTPISVWSGVGTSRTSIGVLLGEAAQNTSAFVTDIKVGSNDIATCADAAEQVGTDIDAALSSDQFKRIVRGAVNVADNPNPSADYPIAGLATMYAAIRTANSAGASAQPEVELINLLFAELVRNDLECLRADGTNKSTCLAMAVQSNDIERNNIQAAANGFDALMYAGAFANQLTAIIIGLGPVLVLFMMFAGAGAARNMKVATHMIVWPLLIMNVGAEMINGMVYISVANFLSALAQGGVINQSAAVEVYKYFALQIGTANHLMATLPILMSTIFALGESAALVRIGDSMTSGPQGGAMPATAPPSTNNAPAATTSSAAGTAESSAGAAPGRSDAVPAFAASAQFGSVRREASQGITSAQQKMQTLSEGTSNLAAWQGALASGDYSKVGVSASTGNALRDVFQQTHGAGASDDPLAMSRSLASAIDSFIQGDSVGYIGGEDAWALQRSADIQRQYARTLADAPSPADAANDAVKRSAGMAALSAKIGSEDIAGQMRTNPAFRQFQLNEGHAFGRMAAAQPYLEQARQDIASGAADGIAGDTTAGDALARHRAALAMATDGQAAPEDRLRANQYLLGTTNAMLASGFIAPDAQPRTAGGQDAAAGDEALTRPAADTDPHPTVLQTYSEDELRQGGLHVPAGTRFFVQPETMDGAVSDPRARDAENSPLHGEEKNAPVFGRDDLASEPLKNEIAGNESSMTGSGLPLPSLHAANAPGDNALGSSLVPGQPEVGSLEYNEAVRNGDIEPVHVPLRSNWSTPSTLDLTASDVDSPSNQAASLPAPDSIKGSQAVQGDDGVVDLGNGKFRLPSGRIVTPNATVRPVNESEIPEIPGPLTLYGSPIDTSYPVINKPAYLKDRSFYYSYGADGTAFWREAATGKIKSPSPPYASPTLQDFADLSRAYGSSNPWAQLPTMGSALGGFALNSAVGTVAMFTGGLGYGAAEALGAGRFLANATGGFAGDATAQLLENASYWATNGRMGRSGIDGSELGLSLILGALPELPGAVRDGAAYLRSKGVPDWRIRVDTESQQLFSLEASLDKIKFDKLYANQLPGSLGEELDTATRSGVHPALPKTAEFDKAIDSTIKFAVNAKGELMAIPKYASDGTEISHAVIHNGQPVIAAGEAEIAGNAVDGYIGMAINPHSGHYFHGNTDAQNAAVDKIARRAFAKYGIEF